MKVFDFASMPSRIVAIVRYKQLKHDEKKNDLDVGAGFV